MSLASSVLRTIRRYEMLSEGGRVAVALSGGPDSVALLNLLRDLEASAHLVIAGVAHFNHQLRGAEADADEAFCRDLAAARGVPIEVGRGDVLEAARTGKRSIEDAARELRYAFLREVTGRLHAEAVAVGHSQDDQAETFLLRLIRGAGTRGLGSIRPKAGVVIRPLIDVARAELRQYTTERRLMYREDATNADVRIPRNRIRHELLPYLAREFSPNIVEVLAREAVVARQDDDRLEHEAIELAASVVLTSTAVDMVTAGSCPGPAADEVVALDAVALASAHPALAARVARRALEQRVGRFVDFATVQRLIDLAREGRPGNRLSLPGQQCTVVSSPGAAGRVRRLLVLGTEPPRPVDKSSEGNEFGFPLSIPGEVRLPGSKLVILSGLAERDLVDMPRGGAPVLLQHVKGPLRVRFRRPGDRFLPPGMGGKAKKLQDYLVDRKVPRPERDRLPLVVDGEDRIVWIVGHAVAEGHRASAPSTGVIFLIARHLGGEV